MNQTILRAALLVIAYRSITFCISVDDTRYDTTVVSDQSQQSGSVAADSTPAVPQQYLKEEPDSVHAVQPAADSGATSGAADSTPQIKSPVSPDTGRFCPVPGMIIPDYADEYYIGKNYHLPEGDLFLLGGTEQFIVKKQFSKNVAIGMAGGPAYESSLQIPYSFIRIKRWAAQDSVEKWHDIDYADTYYSNETYNGAFIDDIPFDAPYLQDGSYFWMNSGCTTDFTGIALKSLQWYLKARLPFGTLSFMIKPLAFGEHWIEQSVLYRSSYNPEEKSMQFSKEGEISTDFQVRNYGVNAGAAFTRQINGVLSVYARCPVDYRRITTSPTRTIAAEFNCYPDNYGRYTRYVKLDTVDVDPYHASSYFFSPRLGVSLDSKAALAWPFVFLPFVAQKATLEGYFGRVHRSWYHGYNYDYAGCSYTSFQNVRFGKRFFTGMENLFSTYADISLGDDEGYYLEDHSSYIPQLIIRDRFFISGISVSAEVAYPGVDIKLFNPIGFGYRSATWGFSLSMALMNLFDQNDRLDRVSFILWKGWK